eukprot:tig00021217_g19333.t1
MVRFKNRYVLAELHWEDGKFDEELAAGHVLAAVRASIQTNFGDIGTARTQQSLQVKYFNNVTNLLIMRVARGPHQDAWAALNFITKIKNRTVTIRVIHVAGTIRSCQKKALEHDRNCMREFIRTRRTAAERERGEELAKRGEEEIARLDL